MRLQDLLAHILDLSASLGPNADVVVSTGQGRAALATDVSRASVVGGGVALVLHVDDTAWTTGLDEHPDAGTVQRTLWGGGA